MAEVLIVLVIAMFVLVVRAKIKSRYDSNAHRRNVNRNYREKRGSNGRLIYSGGAM